MWSACLLLLVGAHAAAHSGTLQSLDATSARGDEGPDASEQSITYAHADADSPLLTQLEAQSPPVAHGVAAASEDSPAADALRGADMRCMGDVNVAHERGCLMRDLYYDREAKTFTLHSRKLEQRTPMKPLRKLYTRFREETSFLEGVQADGRFTVQISHTPPPPAACIVADPVHLRHDYPRNTASIGHLIRDNVRFLVIIPELFGLSAARFSWVTWPWHKSKVRTKHPVVEYSGLASHRPFYRWETLEADCRAQAADSDETGSKTKPRYVRLRLALVSGSSADWTRDGDETGVCGDGSFRRMRDHAYHLYNFPHVPVVQQARLQVSVLIKLKRDKRVMDVPPETTDAVQKQWPEAVVERHTGQLETVVTQLGWLSRTSIFVANIGSPSFRLVYLPDGAQVILVGALEAPITGLDGQIHTFPAAGTNDESTRCWNFLDHVSIINYHVTNVSDVKRYAPRPRTGYQRANWEHVRVRDADIFLRPGPLVARVQEAIGAIDNLRSSGEAAGGSKDES